MTTSLVEERAEGALPASAEPRRWWALAVIAIAQLMVVLDATVVNIALPKAQAALAISDTNRQWVVTAYTLTFGGLLLLGGRVADYWGRKRAFITGIAGFAAASALGGLATNGEMLFAARALQGVFGALLAPASLALLTVMFTEARERAKAFGVYGAIAGGGAALGMVLGGVLTEYANWRWCLLVNIPVAVLAIVAALLLVRESRAHGNTKYDVPGAVLVTLGLGLLVYGFAEAGKPGKDGAQDGWSHPSTWIFIAVAVLLLVAFVVVEARSANPLLPLRILINRNRGGAYLSSVLSGAGFIGAMLFVTYYLQGILGYSPIKAGLGSLPMTGGVLFSAGIASGLLPKVGAKPLMSLGSLMAAGGMVWFTQIGVTTGYASHVLPPMLVLGLGLGLVFVPLGNVALVGVSEHDAGAASAVINASQQVGGSLGTALLNTIATSAASAYIVGHSAGVADPAMKVIVAAKGAVHGYTIAFTWGAVFLAVAAAVIILLVKGGKLEQPAGGAGHPMA